MTAPTATKTRKAAAKGKPAPKPGPAPKPAPAPTPEAPKPAPARSGNSAAAPEEIQEKIAVLLNRLRDEQGLTRPFVIQHIGPDANGRAFNDSMVWRAFNRKAHTVEVDALTAFLGRVTNGELKVDTGRARRPRLDDVQARVTEAIEVLSNEAKTAAQYRKIVDAALEMLRDVVPAPEAPEAAEATEAAEA